MTRTDLTLLEAATLLASGGFNVLPTTSQPTASAPTKSAAKNPGGLLGKGWQTKTSRDPDKLAAWFTETTTGGARTLADIELRADMYREVPFDTIGLAIHAGPDAVIVDIDDPEQVPEHIWPELNTAPFQSSSSVDPRRGHYFFRILPGYRFGHTSAIPTADGMSHSPGEIRHGTAIAVSAPSVHEKAHLGRRYQWQRAGELPVMSEQLAVWLESKSKADTWNGVELSVSEATLESIEAFRDSCTTATAPELLEDHLDHMRMQADIKTLHGAWLPGLIDLMQYALCGFVSAADAMDAAGDAFVEMRTDPSRAAFGGNVRDEETATKEYVDLLRWALGKVQAKYEADTASVQYETYLQAATYYDVAVPTMAPPATYVEPPLPPRGKRQWYHPKEVTAVDGRILVRNTHVDIASALAEEFAATHLWVQNGGAGEGEWSIYDESAAVWVSGGQRTTVASYVIYALANKYAAYDVVDANKALRNGAPGDEIEALSSTYGPSSVFYRLTDKPGTHAPEINYISDMLKTREGVTARREEFDNTDSKIAVANGMLDVKTKHFEPSQPHHKVTKRMPVGYDPAATCPKFLTFLQGAVQRDASPAAVAEAQGVMGLIQRYLGAAILADWGTDSFLIAHGPGGSGKSTVFEDLLRALLGEGSGYWSTIAPSTFTRGISDNGRKFELATVAGSRLLTCNEAFEGGSSIDASFLKGFTDGSLQRAAFKGRDVFSMTPGRVVFLANELPKLTAVDSGISRRALFVEFPHGHSFTDPTLPDPDEKLFERDIVPELPGILNWVIDGAVDYLRHGMNPPTSVYATSKSSLLDSSEIGTFLQHFRPTGEDDPTVVREEFLTLKDLHNLFRDWLEMTTAKGTNPGNMMTEREMLSSIKAAFPQVYIPDNRVNVYLDNGKRAKARPVYGITANEVSGAFLVLREGVTLPDPSATAAPGTDPLTPAPAHSMWAAVSGIESAKRTRVGIPEVEEWRARHENFAAGQALVGEAAE